MKTVLIALAALAAVSVTAASGHYLLTEYRTAQHIAECKRLNSVARGSGFMVDHGSADLFRPMLKETVQQLVAEDCELER